MTEESSLVRPYALTGGRTRPSGRDIPIEAAVETLGAGDTLTYESRQIVELCRTPTTVIDVASQLGLPLGVVRVLVADLDEAGCVRVHHHALDPQRPDVNLLERVLDGIRAL